MDTFDEYYGLFVAAGKPLNDSDKHRACVEWVSLSEEDQLRAMEDAKTLTANAKNLNFLSFPARHLKDRNWTRVAAPRASVSEPWRDWADRQIDRIRGLENFIPAESKDVAARELARALRMATEENGTQIIDDWIAYETQWPKPVDIFHAVAEAECEPAKPIGCEVCKFTGMVIVERGGFTGARDCECLAARKTA